MNWWDSYNLKEVVGPSYKDLKYLGNGLNGVVFRVRKDSDLFAIKFVRIDSGDVRTRQRLESEIDAMKKLAGRCAVRIYESDTTATPPYFLMEYLPNGNLRGRLKSTNSTSTLLDQFLKICRCVEYCHSKGITHRDIKPENILFRTGNQPILSDFGICKFEGLSIGTDPPEMLIKGTPSYMAPEQRRLLPQSKAADVYALGTMLHFDIGAKLPDGALKSQIVKLADRCIRNEPARRLKTKDLIKRIEKIIEGVSNRRDKGIRIRRIVSLIREMMRRVKSEEPNLNMEGSYLLQAMKEFNAIVGDKYHTSGEWHLDEEYRFYSRGMPEYTGNYLKHKEGQLTNAEQKRLLNQEAKLFLAFIIKYLRS